MEIPTVPDIPAYTFYEEEWDSYEELCEQFEWEIPEQFNIATYICDRWAPHKSRVAIIGEDADGNTTKYTYWELKSITDRLANYLDSRGVSAGDRVGINLPQKPETAMAHIAVWKAGAVSVPLSTKFGPNALRYRLDDADVKICIGDEANIEAIRSVRDDIEGLTDVLVAGDVALDAEEQSFWSVISDYGGDFERVDTMAEDDAVIIYTSGTTGPPKGVRHAHRGFLGHFPQFIATVCDMQITRNDVLWTPAEWAWVATVMASLVPALYHGIPVVAQNESGPFSPRSGFRIIDNYGVTLTFLPPTALRMMKTEDEFAEEYTLDSLRAITSGGESLGSDIETWCEDVFEGTAVHEVYGQTEANVLIADVTSLFPRRPGKIGRPIPGHRIAILDLETHEPLEAGEPGEIGVWYEGDPVCFKEYWNKPEATATKIQNGWLLTGDLGCTDEDGYLEFRGRKDDVIISAGYRIGPDEIEDTVTEHPAVIEAGVIGIPDDTRGEVPKAFVTLLDGHEPSNELRNDLQQFVKDALARYEYPREIEFVEDLPQTVTGKTRRKELREREGLAR